MLRGLYLPQAIFTGRRFKRVLLNPPSFKPGSWCGTGKLWIDSQNREYWLTSRPRGGEEKRGYAVEIYRSKDGENFSLVINITKEELSKVSGRTVQSIENQQLLRDPLTGKYFLYISLDVSEKNTAGLADVIYESKWETYLMIADDPSGPWEGEEFVIRGDTNYDMVKLGTPL